MDHVFVFWIGTDVVGYGLNLRVHVLSLLLETMDLML